MASDPWKVYDVFYEQLGNELHDLNATDTIKLALFTSSYTPNLNTDASFSALSGEVSGNGYTAGGNTLANASWDAAAGTLTFDADDTVFTASGGSIVCRYAVIYNASAGGTNDLIASCLLDNTPGDVTVTDGNTLSIAMNASGVFTITQP